VLDQLETEEVAPEQSVWRSAPTPAIAAPPPQSLPRSTPPPQLLSSTPPAPPPPPVADTEKPLIEL
jgi:hypothetical protein